MWEYTWESLFTLFIFAFIKIKLLIQNPNIVINDIHTSYVCNGVCYTLDFYLPAFLLFCIFNKVHANVFCFVADIAHGIWNYDFICFSICLFSVLLISNSWPIDFSQSCLTVFPSYILFLLAPQLFLQKSQLPSLPPPLLTKPPERNYKNQNYLLSSSFNFSKTSLCNLFSFCTIDFTSFFYSESWVFNLFNNPKTMNK